MSMLSGHRYRGMWPVMGFLKGAVAGHIAWGAKIISQLITAKKYNLRVLSLDVLRAKCKGDTFFILGSGPSICDYTPSQWEIIRKGCSIGINNWILHDFVPDFYVGELLIQEDWLKTYKHNFYKKLSQYKQTLIIFKWRPKMVTKLQYIPYHEENVFVALTATIPAGRNESVFRMNLKLLDRAGLLRQSPIFFERAGTVIWCVLFGYKFGFRNIVLCGVDLNTPEYFFEREREKLVRKGFIIPKSCQSGQIHKTLDPSRVEGGIPVDSLIVAIKEVIFDKKGINLFVGAKNSALYPALPVYPW